MCKSYPVQLYNTCTYLPVWL